MRLLLVACLLVLGWCGLYLLAQEFSGSLALTTLNEIAALAKRPVATSARSVPAKLSTWSTQQPFPPAWVKLPASAPKWRDASPEELAMNRVSQSGPLWMQVLLTARLRRGPSVETPIIATEAVGTMLRVNRARQGWFEVNDIESGESGWVYWRYLRAVDDNKVQSVSGNLTVTKRQFAQVAALRDSSSANRVAATKQKPRPSYLDQGSAGGISQSREAKFARRPPHSEMANLLEHAFSGH